MFKIVKYENEDGECPINNYIENLMVLKKEKEIKKIYYYIQLLEEYGYKLPGISKEYAKHLGDQLYELRPGNNRVIYFFYDGDNEYVLLHGFTKKQKRPQLVNCKEQKKKKKIMKGEKRMKESEKFDLFKDIFINEKDKRMIDRINMHSNIIFKLVKKRIELNISQRELALRTNIKQPMIARIETMKTTPRIDTLIAMAEALDLSLDLKSKFETKKTEYVIIYSPKQEYNFNIDGFNRYEGGKNELFFN